MATWGFFSHGAAPIPHHPHPILNSIISGANEFLVAGAGGLGMFSEAYFLFAIGNIKTIWEVLYPTCFGAPVLDAKSECSEQLVSATTYVEVAALIVGMIVIGVLAQTQGRRFASRTTAVLMLLGGTLLVVATAQNLTSMFIVFNVGLAVFGVATGGEYPTAATTAAEAAELGEKPHHREKRGRLMVLTFAMQGWGNMVNTSVIAFFIAVTGNSNCPTTSTSPTSDLCNVQGLDITWRVQYAIGLLVIMWMVIYRFCMMKESAVWEERQKRLSEIRRTRSNRNRQFRAERFGFLTMKEYNTRLFGVSFCWYLSDVAFYGTKLFQGTLAAAVLGESNTIQNIIIATLIYSAVSLVGYYLAALTVDHMGRVRMQSMGFLVVGIIYIICGSVFGDVTESNAAFAALFFISSLFLQWGPNATTWLLPGELFPTPIRSEAHGIAASCGKLGALSASLVFSLANSGEPVSASIIFLVGGVSCLVGFVVTVLFVPDTTQLMLKEVDKRWDREMEGQEYRGPAKSWENLSTLECWMLSVSRGDTVANTSTNDDDDDGDNTQADREKSPHESSSQAFNKPASTSSSRMDLVSTGTAVNLV